MLKRPRSLPRPRTGALLTATAALLSAGVLGAAAPAGAATAPQAPGPSQVQGSAGEKTAGKSRVTAAVLPLDGTGRTPTLRGADVPYDTASIVKVDILATALLQAQDAHRPLTARERALADPMIRHSDNAAANTLWRQIGRAPGLEAANKRLGLTSTKGGPGAKWGLTRTTASDQIRLLRAVFDTGGTARGGSAALTAQSRAYIRALMTNVAPDQAWGVSSAGTQWALKNGWLQRNTSGLWDVNSVGRISVDGHPCLVAVLSDGNASMSDGIRLVQGAARAAVSSATGSGH
ncbi:serine hydrolase [Streptomyces sp. NPDC003374]